jgi:hypothetical protein
MLKKIIQISSLVFTLAVASGISANAASLSGNEEDAAAPAGSFTSDMAAPARLNFESDRRARHERFVLRFAENRAAYEARHNGEPQK